MGFGNSFPGFFPFDTLTPATLPNFCWMLDGNSPAAVKYIGTNNAQPFPIYTNGVQRMVVLSSGEIGIGEPAPLWDLEISKSSNGNQGIVINNNDNTGFEVLGMGEAGGSGVLNFYIQRHNSNVPAAANRNGVQIVNAENSWLTLETNSTPRVYISNAGTVGIATTTPDANVKLHVVDNVLIGTATSDFFAGLTGAINIDCALTNTYIHWQDTTGPADRAFFGVATAINQIVTGSAVGDLCISMNNAGAFKIYMQAPATAAFAINGTSANITIGNFTSYNSQLAVVNDNAGHDIQRWYASGVTLVATLYDSGRFILGSGVARSTFHNTGSLTEDNVTNVAGNIPTTAAGYIYDVNATCTITLQAIATADYGVGKVFRFFVNPTFTLTINADAADNIFGAASIAVAGGAGGAMVTLRAITATKWGIGD